MQKLDSLLLNKLVNSFKSIQNIYVISNNIFKFKEILTRNKLFFSYDILSKLLNPKIKIESKKLYISLNQKQINVNKIKINNKYIYTCTYGNTKLLESNLKKQYIYYSEDMSIYGKQKHEYFLNHKLIKENINVCVGINNLNKNSSNIVILNMCNMSELRSVDTKLFNRQNLYIFNFYDINHILSISDNLLIVEAKYENNIANLVDRFLDLGKDILILPGDVWNKSCYFSNFLIKEGANVILNVGDINIFL